MRTIFFAVPTEEASVKEQHNPPFLLFLIFPRRALLTARLFAFAVGLRLQSY